MSPSSYKGWGAKTKFGSVSLSVSLYVRGQRPQFRTSEVQSCYFVLYFIKCIYPMRINECLSEFFVALPCFSSIFNALSWASVEKNLEGRQSYPESSESQSSRKPATRKHVFVADFPDIWQIQQNSVKMAIGIFRSKVGKNEAKSGLSA